MSNIAHSMYSSYNKGGGGTKCGGVRLGNWQEELALESVTGHSRAPAPKTVDYYNNHGRVIAHKDCLDPSEFKSTAHAAMSQKAEPKPRGVGPRQQRKADRQLAQARAEAAAAESAKEKIKNTVTYESVNMATYKVNDSAVSRLSNPDKSAKLFGGEVTKASLEKEDIALLPPGDYCGSTGVSYWTNQLTNPDKITDFPITAGNSQNPFARSSTFTNDIRDGRLRHSEGCDLMGTEPHGMGRDRNGISEKLTEDFHSGSSFPTW
ncbi:hypothetical protein TrST_g1125 [Triparma strigata]|uniref:Uncharacterized protein n=1 Tax=Triparma strigata TaxID=1606541 RepID=A0A9W7EAU6_9STRA|nr:hypothetical protein TrST_g1125 [Triparma strigata]